MCRGPANASGANLHSSRSSQARREAAEVAAARSVLDWANAKGLDVSWGKGNDVGSFFAVVNYRSGTVQVVSVWTDGHLEVLFSELAKPRGGPFQSPEQRNELARKLGEIPGIVFQGESSMLKRPKISLAAVSRARSMSQLVEVLSWVVDEVVGFFDPGQDFSNVKP